MNGWQHFQYVPSRSHTQMYEASGEQTDGVPCRAQLSHAMVLNHGTRLLLAGYASFIEDLPSLVGLDSLLHSQLAKDWQIKITIIGKLTELKAALWKGDGYIVSDSSYQNEAGVVAWIIEGQSGGPQNLTCFNVLSGTATSHAVLFRAPDFCQATQTHTDEYTNHIYHPAPIAHIWHGG